MDEIRSSDTTPEVQSVSENRQHDADDDLLKLCGLPQVERVKQKARSKSSDVMAISSVMLAVLSVVLACFLAKYVVPMLVGITAILLSVICKKRCSVNGQRIAMCGFFFGVVGTATTVFLLLYYIFVNPLLFL